MSADQKDTNQPNILKRRNSLLKNMSVVTLYNKFGTKLMFKFF
jgi:hypothetical protein